MADRAPAALRDAQAAALRDADALIAPLLAMAAAPPFAELEGIAPLPDVRASEAAYRAAFEGLPPAAPVFCATLRGPSAFAFHCWQKCCGFFRAVSAAVQPSGVTELPAFTAYDFVLAAPAPSPRPSDVHEWSAVFAEMLAAQQRKSLGALVVEPLRGLSPLFAAVPLLAPGAWAVLPPDAPPQPRAAYYETLQELFGTVECVEVEGRGSVIVCRNFRKWRLRDTPRLMEAVVRGEAWRSADGVPRGAVPRRKAAPWPAALCPLATADADAYATGLRSALFCR